MESEQRPQTSNPGLDQITHELFGHGRCRTEETYASEPWSAPRLRGRGKQGNIVMHIPFLTALYWRRLHRDDIKSAAGR